MFDKLKSALSSLTQLATHASLSKEEVDKILWEFEISLIESDVASEVIESINSNLKQQLYGMKIPRSEDRAKFVREQLKQSIRQTFAKTKSVNVIELIRAKAKTSNKDGSSPYVILFLGINGTGKTTTVAKFANMLKKNKISVVLACADTHRAGAIEQLSEHANRLGLKAISLNPTVQIPLPSRRTRNFMLNPTK